MSFIASIKTCFKNYAVFSGRAARSEFWWFTLFLVLGNIAATMIDSIVFSIPPDQSGPLNSIFSLGTLLPSIAVSVRRLHDLQRSGWWLLLIFIPLLGWLTLLFWEVSKGTDGTNRFGPDPLAGAAYFDDPSLQASSIPSVRRRD
jgi:uncharacterized membrane protein YhaH (DUF805 family)